MKKIAGNRKNLISIIVPIFNTEKYLLQCLDSIARQTYKNIQIVLVDDGSDDSSSRICDSYAQNDDRVVVIHKKNEGLVLARKTGLRNALGNYIMFVDADDWIDEDMCSSLMDKMEEHDANLISSAIFRQFDEKSVLNENVVEEGFYDKSMLIKKVYPLMLYDGHFFGFGIRPNLVGKILKKNLLNHILAQAPDNVTNGEDAMITYPYLLKCSSAYFTNKAFYHYRQYPESMSQMHTNSVELQQLKHLHAFLEGQFLKIDYENNLQTQLRYYFANILIQRCIEKFDISPGQFKMYGNVESKDLIAVYGAGKFGKQLYSYAKKTHKNVIWFDKNADYYKKQGLHVYGLEKILEISYDKILIAVIDMNMAIEIIDELVELGVPKRKIRYLDIDYITENQTLSRILEEEY